MQTKSTTLSAIAADGAELLIEYSDRGAVSRFRGRAWRQVFGRRQNLTSSGGWLALFDLDRDRIRYVPLPAVRAVTAGGRRFVVA